MMLFTLGAKIKNLIQAFKERVLGDLGQFEAESCLNTQLTQLDNQSLLDSASLVVTPNGYKETLLYAVEPNEVVTNLVLRSQDFTQSVWSKGGATIVSSTRTAPDGTATATELSDVNASNTPGVPIQSGIVATSTNIVFSIYTKNVSSTVPRRFLLRNATAATNFFTLPFDYSSTGNLGNGWFSEDVGNGWFRLSFVRTIGISVGDALTIYYGRTGAAPVGATDVWQVWGAQLVPGSTITDYISTTDRQIINGTIGDMSVTRATTATRVNSDGFIEQVPYNLFQRSEEFEQAIWTKTAVSIIQNTQISPIGNLTADTLRIGVDASSVRHRLFQQLFTQSGTTYTTSYYLKKANHRWIQLNYVSDTVFGISNWANFDLENGVIGNTGPGAIATITDVGNGWYRCTLQAIAITSINTTSCEIIVINNTNSGRYPSYQSTIAEDVCYVWGAQLVTGSSAKDYFPTTNRFNVPRIDYSNGSCPSILVEPQRTNLVVQNQNMTVSPWIYQNANGVSTNDLNPSGQNSSNRINLLLSGFSSVRQAIPSLNNTTYTISCFFKKIPGFDNSFEMRYTNELVVPNNFNAIAFINPNTKTATFSLFGTNGTGISGSITGKVDLYPNDWFRVSMTFTSGSAAANVNALFRPAILINSTASVLIWGAQLELGTNVTSYIPTVASTVTRNADVITNTNASTLIGQTEGVIYIQTSRQVITSTGGWIFRIDDNTENNRLGIFSLANTGNLAVNISRSGVGLDIMTYNNFLSLTNQGNAKIALAYKNGDFALAVNGAIVATSSNSGTIPFMNSCRSSTIGGGLIPNQSTNCISLFKTRLTNTQLQQLTTL